MIDLPGPFATKSEVLEIITDQMPALKAKLSSSSVWKWKMCGVTDRVHTLYTSGGGGGEDDGQKGGKNAERLICTLTENEPCMVSSRCVGGLVSLSFSPIYPSIHPLL